jgi:hypothetical protein
MKLSTKQTIFKEKKQVNFKEKVQQAILTADGFGCPVQLLCKKNEQHQTLYGGCFTLIIMFLACYYLYQLYIIL